MNITLKKKKLQNGKLSWYLEYYKDSTLNLEGKRFHLRHFKYLILYPQQDPCHAENSYTTVNTGMICTSGSSQLFGKVNANACDIPLYQLQN